jgi:hypothetical protein
MTQTLQVAAALVVIVALFLVKILVAVQPQSLQ